MLSKKKQDALNKLQLYGLSSEFYHWIKSWGICLGLEYVFKHISSPCKQLLLFTSYFIILLKLAFQIPSLHPLNPFQPQKLSYRVFQALSMNCQVRVGLPTGTWRIKKGEVRKINTDRLNITISEKTNFLVPPRPSLVSSSRLPQLRADKEKNTWNLQLGLQKGSSKWSPLWTKETSSQISLWFLSPNWSGL